MTTTANTTDKASLISSNGWDKGLIFFGFAASETTVKVATALQLVAGQDNFPYSKDDIRHVDMSFDDRPLKTDKKGKQSLGVSSEEWMVMSDNKGYMPAIMMEGKMFMESGKIVKYFAEEYPDKDLSKKERTEVMKWIDLNVERAERILEAEKHWGLCALSPDKPNYVHLGPGKKDLAWEKATIKYVDDFMKILDEHFENKENKTYFVGNKLTLADCAMINWPWSLSHTARLKVSHRYPNLWAHHTALRATNLDGAADHYSTIPMIGLIVAGLNLTKRGVFSYGHHIENPKYWE